MPHVLVAGRIHESGLAVLREAPGLTVETVDEVTTDAFAPRAPDADAILIRTQPLPAAVIATARRLSLVSRHGVGYDAVDVDALSARGIPLAVIGDVNSGAVAEHTLALMLALARRIVVYDARTRAGDWGFRNSQASVELAGRRLLVLGFGRIGRQVAALARAFSMTVSAYDPFVDPAAMRERGVAPAAVLAEALATADVVSVHMPMSGGRPLVGAAELALLPPGALVVNTARGGIVDEAALADAVAAGRLAGAALDVFEDEPPAADNALLASDRVVVTPHAATLTRECAERMAVAAARNVVDHFAGRLDPSLVVNAAAVGLAPRPGAAPGAEAAKRVALGRSGQL